MPTNTEQPAAAVVPEDYVCGVCHAHGCKLWRDYNGSPPRLMCATCAAANEGKSVADIDAEGLRGENRTDQIGYCVPAVPTADGFGYHGYGKVPKEAVAWWTALPTLPTT